MPNTPELIVDSPNHELIVDLNRAELTREPKKPLEVKDELPKIQTYKRDRLEIWGDCLKHYHYQRVKKGSPQYDKVRELYDRLMKAPPQV
jgi:hypothetical protein